MTSTTYTLPNGTTRTTEEIAAALERVAVMDPAQPVCGWSSEPMTAGAAVEILSEALDMLTGSGPYALTLHAPTVEELDAEAAQAKARAEKNRAETALREPLRGRSVACQGVLFREDETLFSGLSREAVA
jgi:hypothetical protein